jgi:hypothetical protein
MRQMREYYPLQNNGKRFSVWMKWSDITLDPPISQSQARSSIGSAGEFVSCDDCASCDQGYHNRCRNRCSLGL